MDLLFATMPGHVAPLLPIARALTSRGHRVRWCTGRVFADRITATGAEFVAMDPSIDHLGRNVDELFPERTKLNGVALARAPGSATLVPSSPDTATGPSRWKRMAGSFPCERVHGF
ncbi:hypothetical protein ABZ345_37210 [Lentzea sp. NPDC005914]|uniref:glycosyltransferase n=1 Tax=Lentzea sp. NPDC005914 TaxID=3154572 RepID=UPI0033DC9853